MLYTMFIKAPYSVVCLAVSCLKRDTPWSQPGHFALRLEEVDSLVVYHRIIADAAAISDWIRMRAPIQARHMKLADSALSDLPRRYDQSGFIMSYQTRFSTKR
jgi:hypothetical protein